MNGNFRGFAFIGFKDENAARTAVDQHNKTYLDNTKISVEVYNPEAKPIKELLNKGKRSMSKPDEVKPVKEKKPKFNPLDEYKDDPQFQEFLKVQKNLQSVNKKNYVWSDDVRLDGEKEDEVDVRPTKEKAAKDVDLQQPKKPKNKTPQEYLFTVKLTKLPFKVKKQMIKKFFEPLKTSRVKLPASVKGIAYASFSTEADLKKALTKHKSLMDGRQVDVHVFKNENFTKPQDSQTGPSKALPAKEPKEYKVIKDSVADTGRLYVRNLSYSCTTEDLEDHFSKYGQVTEVHLPIDNKTKVNKGFAFISFLFPEHAVRSMEELDKKIFQGRLLHILPGESKPENQQTLFRPLSTFKQKKNEELRTERQNPETWNSLFLGSNAVSDVASRKFNVKKSDLLDASQTASDSVAVRMTLAETQIVNETKKFLVENGVSLESFNQNPDESSEDHKMKKRKRSRTVILVKNLPAHSDPQEVKSLFTRFGSVRRLILPTHGVTAIIEMAEPNEAKKAFSKLSVVKFKHVPLYLEWAPVDIFSSKRSDDQTESDPPQVNLPSADSTEDKSDQTSNSALTIFVKNINFDTSDESMHKHFSACGKVTSARICRRKSNNGNLSDLSMGYGFVTYANQKSFDKALRGLQNQKLDGHVLELSKSHQSIQSSRNQPNFVSSDQTKIQSKPGTKIIVRNVPFEATQKEVEEIFRWVSIMSLDVNLFSWLSNSAFGGVKSVRLPKKLSGTGTHRGFAFVEFQTKHDAERSLESLSGSTHLYGRRLVLEWAKQESD